jgi:hypothetical protein
MGDEPGFRRAIEVALEHADDAGPTAALAPCCTTSYLQSEAGAAALVFGEPRLAVRYLEPAAHDWPHGQQRDLALCLARLSVAYSRDGRLEQAAETALRARRAATTAFSRRFEDMQLHAVDGHARDPGGCPFACENGGTCPRERRAVGARPEGQPGERPRALAQPQALAPAVVLASPERLVSLERDRWVS